MMLRRNLRKGIELAIISVALLLVIIPSVFAAEPHEDPEIAKPVFSGVSLFRYYADALDLILQKDPIAVESGLEKIPFVNIPQSLEDTAQSFATSSVSISHLVVTIDNDLVSLVALSRQFRLDEATELVGQISDNLSRAKSELIQVEQAAKTTSVVLRVSSSPERSDLKQSYNEVLDRISNIRNMLALYEDLLKSIGLTPEELLKSTGLTLEIQPAAAFVGDNISFEGMLTSDKGPLAGREVDILLSGSRYITAKTNAQGHYQGTLMVPYRYLPELDLQALYYPRDKDIGLYLASLSPVIKLKVLFYETRLEVILEDRAYPGLDTTVKGRFTYGESPLLSERKVEVYLDDVFVTEAIAQEAFTQKIEVAPDTDLGKHVVTVSAAAVGRYSPVVAITVLNVTKATPILELNVPKAAFVPARLALEGRLYSEVDQLSGASVRIGLGKSQVEMVSSEDGTFQTKIKTGMGLGLIGSQDLVIQVIPREPWHATLATTRPVLMVNVVNLSGVLVLLVILGIYLPGRLRRILGAYPGRTARPEIAGVPPEQVPAYSEIVIIHSETKNSAGATGEPRDRIFYWYRLAVRLLRKLNKVLFLPQQTLREFAGENSNLFGPLAKYFTELTKTVERLLYSQYIATEKDAENSKGLAETIDREITK